MIKKTFQNFEESFWKILECHWNALTWPKWYNPSFLVINLNASLSGFLTKITCTLFSTTVYTDKLYVIKHSFFLSFFKFSHLHHFFNNCILLFYCFLYIFNSNTLSRWTDWREWCFTQTNCCVSTTNCLVKYEMCSVTQWRIREGKNKKKQRTTCAEWPCLTGNEHNNYHRNQLFCLSKHERAFCADAFQLIPFYFLDNAQSFMIEFLLF